MDEAAARIVAGAATAAFGSVLFQPLDYVKTRTQMQHAHGTRCADCSFLWRLIEGSFQLRAHPLDRATARAARALDGDHGERVPECADGRPVLWLCAERAACARALRVALDRVRQHGRRLHLARGRRPHAQSADGGQVSVRGAPPTHKLKSLSRQRSARRAACTGTRRR